MDTMIFIDMVIKWLEEKSNHFSYDLKGLDIVILWI